MICPSSDSLVYLFKSGEDSVLNMIQFRDEFKGNMNEDRGDKIFNFTGTQILAMQSKKEEVGDVKKS